MADLWSVNAKTLIPFSEVQLLPQSQWLREIILRSPYDKHWCNAYIKVTATIINTNKTVTPTIDLLNAIDNNTTTTSDSNGIWTYSQVPHTLSMMVQSPDKTVSAKLRIHGHIGVIISTIQFVLQ